MDCKQFAHWLENRDNHDVSEADQALKHARTCKECQAKLRVDEKLDTLIRSAMGREIMPGSLPGKVDLNLAGMRSSRSRASYRWLGAFSAMLAVMLVFGVALMFTPSGPSMDEVVDHAIADHNGHDDTILVVRDLQDIYRLGDLQLSLEEIMAELPQGLAFVGARICPLGECEAIHMVLRQNDRRISVYLIKAEEVDFSLSTKGRYSLERGQQSIQLWQRGEYVFAMVG